MKRSRGLATISLVATAVMLLPITTQAGRLRGQTSTSLPECRITAYPRHVVQTIPSTFFGVNDVAFWDAAERSPASARALAQTPIKMVRFGGGDPGDWYDWQDPYYKHWSHTSPLDLWHYAQAFGGVPLFQTNYQGHLPNPPGKRYAVNSPENQAAWVSYNRQQGIPAVMEVGNEEDLGMHRANDPAFHPYITVFNAQARAMHRADPSVKVIGPAGTNEYYWWGLNDLGMFLQSTGNKTGSSQADGVSLHFYRGTSWSDTKDTAQYWLSPGGPWHAIQAMIRAHDTRNLPVYITEWNVGTSNNGTGFNQTMGHALIVADLLGAFARSGVASEEYFDIHGGTQYGLLYGSGDAKSVDAPTPSFYTMALWAHMGSKMIASTACSDPGMGLSAWTSLSAHGDSTLLAINKGASTRRLVLTLAGSSLSGRHVSVYSLVSPHGATTESSAVYNGQVDPSPQRPLPAPRDGGVIHGASFSSTIPPYSAVVLSVSKH